MSESESSCGCGFIDFFVYILAVAYAFKYWGFWWGMLNIILPFSLIVDAVKLLLPYLGNLVN